MWQAPEFIRRIGTVFRVTNDDFAHEPLPERWVDLINYLNEREQAQQRAQHWSDRAEEARLRAVDMTDPQAKRQMLMIAAEYRRLAGHADRTAAKEAPRV